MKKNSFSSESMESDVAITPNQSETKTKRVERMFNSIASRYDLLNRIMTAGIDKRWRKKAMQSLHESNPQKLLDIATGTGDFAIMAWQELKPDSISAIDISKEMLAVAQDKIAKLGLSPHISLGREDCSKLSFPNESFDATTVAFGVRNFENLEESLKEIHRVLKPSGRLVILELTIPENFIVKQFYRFYTKIIIPCLGKLISMSGSAYSYLPRSIEVFVQGNEFKKVLYKCGFSDVTYKSYTLGVCTMYLAIK